MRNEQGQSKNIFFWSIANKNNYGAYWENQGNWGGDGQNPKKQGHRVSYGLVEGQVGKISNLIIGAT